MLRAHDLAQPAPSEQVGIVGRTLNLGTQMICGQGVCMGRAARAPCFGHKDSKACPGNILREYNV